MQYLGKILPVDGYHMEMNASLPADYLAALIHLYQPLVGINAIHFYQLLLQEEPLSKEVHLQAHHHLMNYLNQSLDQIYEARVKLEAIGLLQTFKKNREDKTIYTYVLIPPFRPAAFFGDLMLAELLYRQIGKTKFNTLKAHYTEIPVVEKGENITVSFNDVFQPFTPDGEVKITPVPEQQTPGVPIQSIDFSLLSHALTKSMIPADKVLTETNQRMINQLAVMYDLELEEIEKALMWALTDENEVDISQFKAACQDFFAKKENVLPQAEATTQQESPAQAASQNKPRTKTEELIQHFETITPKQLLEDMSKGNNASVQDIDNISEIATRQNVSNAVLNVAIHYVMLQSNHQLSKRYLETIVSHWSRLGYTTAKQAMDHVVNQQQKNANKQPAARAKKSASEEVIPDWFKNRKTKPQQEKANNNEKQNDLAEKDLQELESLLKRHTSKK